MVRVAPVRFALLLGLCTVLAACQSSQERAEAYYRDALELMEQGDPQRALVTLRNVFDLDGTHREARTLYAGTLRDLGRDRDAYGQYLRLSEQYPDDLTARVALGEIALSQQNWSEARRHGAAARALAPDDIAVRIIGVNIDYADALEAEEGTGDPADRRAVVDRAAALSREVPENLPLRRILVDDALRDEDPEAALALIEAALQVAPGNRDLQDTRVSLLVDLGRTDALEAALTEMIARFPEDASIVANLVRYYVSREELDAAEAFLRGRVAAAAGGEAASEALAAAHIDLVQFLLRLRGPDAALTELDRVVAEAETEADRGVLRSLAARIRFDRGETGAAIAQMETLVSEGGDGIAANDDRIVLARMLEQTGDRNRARALVGEVLDLDRTQVAALKLEAGWQISDDLADSAISLLRTALDEAPQDVEALTLMAQAHLRNGNRDLARDVFSLAVEASNTAPEETRRYVALLQEDGRYQLAEQVLTDALRLAPDNLSLLLDLGAVQIQQEDWSRTRQVEARMRALRTPRRNPRRRRPAGRAIVVRGPRRGGGRRAGGPGAAQRRRYPRTDRRGARPVAQLRRRGRVEIRHRPDRGGPRQPLPADDPRGRAVGGGGSRCRSRRPTGSSSRRTRGSRPPGSGCSGRSTPRVCRRRPMPRCAKAWPSCPRR